VDRNSILMAIMLLSRVSAVRRVFGRVDEWLSGGAGRRGRCFAMELGWEERLDFEGYITMEKWMVSNLLYHHSSVRWCLIVELKSFSFR
jgi:hypothetical protein